VPELTPLYAHLTRGKVARSLLFHARPGTEWRLNPVRRCGLTATDKEKRVTCGALMLASRAARAYLPMHRQFTEEPERRILV
jgi:hypothetical protein